MKKQTCCGYSEAMKVYAWLSNSFTGQHHGHLVILMHLCINIQLFWWIYLLAAVSGWICNSFEELPHTLDEIITTMSYNKDTVSKA